MPKRILVIPVFNEATTIMHVLQRAHTLVDKIILVNDGSTDQSAQLIRDWCLQHPSGVLLSLPENRGMAGALLAGLAYVMRLCWLGQVRDDDVVIAIDADGQHMPEEIPLTLKMMAGMEVDVLLGRRDLSGYPWLKRFGNWALSLWASLLSGYRYHDVECGFRLLRVAVLPDLISYYTGHRYSCAQEIGIITARRGWKVNNRLTTTVAYYRKGARHRDGLINLTMSIIAFVRLLTGWHYDLGARVDTVLAGVNEECTHLMAQ